MRIVLSAQLDAVLLIKWNFSKTDLICKEIKKRGQDMNKYLDVSGVE